MIEPLTWFTRWLKVSILSEIPFVKKNEKMIFFLKNFGLTFRLCFQTC